LSVPRPDIAPSHSFSLTPARAGENETPRSNLLFDAALTGVTVPGVVLEAQYRCGELHLLLTTENIPYEEALHVLLLDARFNLLDQVELSHPYASGALTDLQQHGDGRLQFSLFGGDRWELAVLPTPRRLTMDEAPTGVRGRLRRLLAPRWLAVKRLQVATGAQT